MQRKRHIRQKQLKITFNKVWIIIYKTEEKTKELISKKISILSFSATIFLQDKRG